MRTVEHDGERYLLLEQSGDSSLVRNPDTGEERYLPNDELETSGESPLVVAANRVSGPVRRVVTAVHSEQTLGVLVELYERGPLSVREILGTYDLCESDVHGIFAELRAAGLVEEVTVDGERGYELTESGRDGLEGLL